MPEIQELILPPYLQEYGKARINHTMYSAAWKILERVVKRRNFNIEPVSAMILGEGGCGKTSLCKAFTHMLGEKHTIAVPGGEQLIVPSFYCSVPSGASELSLALVMLSELGITIQKGERTNPTQRLQRLLAECKTVVILLDEVHNLLNKENEKSRDRIRNWLKQLMNITGVPVVIVGTPDCEHIINDPKDQHQISRRYPYRIILTRFPFSLDENSEYKMFLAALVELILSETPIKTLPDLASDEAAIRLYAASGGSPSGIRLIVDSAVLDVCEAMRKDLTWADIRMATLTTTVSFALTTPEEAMSGDLSNLRRTIQHVSTKNPVNI